MLIYVYVVRICIYVCAYLYLSTYFYSKICGAFSTPSWSLLITLRMV